MRKIDQEIVEAIAKRNNLSKANTHINYSLTNELSVVYLHGHEIAVVEHDKNRIRICFCGYPTNVTRDRINAVLEGAGKTERFRIHKGEPVLMPNNMAVGVAEKVVIL